MSGTYKFKEIYSEGVLKGSQSQIKKSSGASALTPDAAAQLGPKAVELQRKKAKQVDVPGFVKTVRNEEVELGEAKVESGKSQEEKEIIRNKRAGIDKDPMAFPGRKMQNIYRMELHMDTRGEKKERGKKVNEKIDVGADAGATISDFVHSKSATFKGDSKKQRIKRALGAYYAAQKEETENIYNYVIETLVGSEFAEDYETAENMFEHMSSEFVAVILEEYIEEKARGTRPKRTVHAYDVDETLFGHGKKGKPNVQVHVKDGSGKRVKSLSNQEFNTHKLDKGHSYDFSEFQSAKTFTKTSTPNKSMIKDIKRKQARGQNVHLVTARSKFDDPKEFHGHLKKHGIDVPMNKIHYTGGMKGGDIGDKKVKVASAIAKKSGTSNIHMHDDAAKVHKSFQAHQTENPTSVNVKTHLVKPNKKGEAMSRSYQATKEDFDFKDTLFINFSGTSKAKNELKEESEMTPYQQWKTYMKENEVEEIEESVEIDTDLNEETESMNSYQTWKSYLESI